MKINRIKRLSGVLNRLLYIEIEKRVYEKMTEILLDFMLGPLRSITDFYFENQMIFNAVVIFFALYKLFVKKRRASGAN